MIRRGGPQDVPFLKAMLPHAYNWHVNVLDAEIPLSRYVENWGRRGDAAVIALEAGHPIGAAWFRIFPPSSPGYGFVDEQTPELSIAVVPSRRKHGVGRELMDALLERVQAEGHDAVSLSVESGSPAVTFYERYGFERVGEAGGAITMRADLASRTP